MRHYTITLNEEQLMLVSNCVEDIHRFLCGDTELCNATAALGSWQELQGKLKELQPLVTPGLDSRSNYGWNGGHCPDEAQRRMIAQTYYLYREMRHKYTLANKHNNVYSSPTLRCEDSGETVEITWEE